MPGITIDSTNDTVNGHVSTNGQVDGKPVIPKYTPMQLSGALDKFESLEVTPCLGTEFRNVSLAEWMRAENSDALLRDLAILSK